jgi:hypothetical protein
VDKIQKELRLLKVYALVSTVLFATLIFLAAKGTTRKVKFDEIDAERINVIEPDGKVRLTLANAERMPGGTIAGVELKSREGHRVMMKNGAPGAGLLFFNDEGDECGGLLYSSKIVGGKPKAGMDLTFDHYRQNEAIAISNGDGAGGSRSGLEVIDQPTAPISTDFVRQYEAIQLMKEGQEKQAALNKLNQEHAGEFGWTPRVFVGRLAENNAASVILMDTKAHPRIRMVVDASDVPSLQFLDEHGKVIYSLPDHGAADKQ